MSGARNTGIRNSNGDYLLFVDGDDYLSMGAVDAIIDWIETNEKKDISSDLLRFQYRIIPHSECEKTNKYKVSDLKVVTVQASSYFEVHNLLCNVWVNVFKRACIMGGSGILFFENGIYREDELWTPQMMLGVRRMDITEQKLYCYCSNPNSIMRDTQNRKKHNEDWKKVVKILKSIADKPDCAFFFIMRFRKVVLAQIRLLAYQNAKLDDLENYISFLKEEGLFPMKLYGCNENVTIQMHIFAWLCNFKITRYFTFICLRHNFARNLRREEY